MLGPMVKGDAEKLEKEESRKGINYRCPDVPFSSKGREQDSKWSPCEYDNPAVPIMQDNE